MTISYTPQKSEPSQSNMPAPRETVDWYFKKALLNGVLTALGLVALSVGARLTGWPAGYFWLAAALLTGFMFWRSTVLLTLITASIGLFTAASLNMLWWQSAGAVLVLSLLVIFLTGIQWNTESVQRPWRHQDEDRAARPVEVETITEVMPLPDGETIRTLTARILTLHFTGQTDEERQAIRPWCVTQKICTDDEWEYVNKVLQALGAKKARGWIEGENALPFDALMATLYKVPFEPQGYNATVNGIFIRFRDYPLTTGGKRA